MKIIISKSAGFCFGVKNAVEKAIELSDKGKNVYTYGPIIHNTQVVNELKNKGVEVVNSIDDIGKNDVVVIRSHGISKEEYTRILDRGAEIIDATCPNVKHIHEIVEQKLNEGYTIIIIGNPEHPEVKGINGWCDSKAIIVNNQEDIDNININLPKVCIVAQTTYNQEKWYSMSCHLLKSSKQILLYNTICSATETRQREVNELSMNVDTMIIVGGKESSNTQKLYEISKQNCGKTIFIEGVNELNLDDLSSSERVGIAGGASTPDYVIKEVTDKIESKYGIENLNREESIEEIKEDEENDYSLYFSDVYVGNIVNGQIIKVTDKEVFLDIGYKSDAVLTIDEDYGVEFSLKEKYNPGDTLELEVINMNDGEGNVVVSRKSFQREEYLNSLNKLKNEEKNIDVMISGVNKGGFSCKYGDMNAFMPLSLSGTIPGEDLNLYIGHRVQVRINEIKEKKQGIELVVSRKEILKEEKEQRIKELFTTIEEGQIVGGKVKSIINVGAFINIGDIDVFVPISEISWRRIKTPNDVIEEGQTVEVKIIKVDRDNLKITGSIKKSGKEPWKEFVTRFKEGDIVTVKVARFVEFGAFAEVIDGIDGLIHISQMADRRINRPQEVLKIGQEVKAKVIKIDNETKRVGLSLKDID